MFMEGKYNFGLILSDILQVARALRYFLLGAMEDELFNLLQMSITKLGN